MTSLDSLLSELYSLGWYLYSLADDPDGRYDHWFCTIRLEAGAASLASFGQGPTASIALSMAIDQIPGAKPHQIPKPAVALDHAPYSSAEPPAPRASLSELMSRRKPAITLTRRI